MFSAEKGKLSSVNGATSKCEAVKEQAFVVSLFLRKYLQINLTQKF